MKAETQAALVKKVKAAMKEQNATDDYVLTQTLKGVTLDPAKSVEDLTKEMLVKYDAEFKACRGNGATPDRTKKVEAAVKPRPGVTAFSPERRRRKAGRNPSNPSINL